MAPVWYWIVCAMLFVWNAAGCFLCLTQLLADAERIATWPEPQRHAWLAMPVPARVGYVAAVSAGLLGSVALLLRSLAAGPLFIASLTGVIIQFGWFFAVYRGAARAGGSSILFPALIATIAIGEIGFACWARTAGLLG